jgi:hypothetical protein
MAPYIYPATAAMREGDVITMLSVAPSLPHRLWCRLTRRACFDQFMVRRLADGKFFIVALPWWRRL